MTNAPTHTREQCIEAINKYLADDEDENYTFVGIARSIRAHLTSTPPATPLMEPSGEAWINDMLKKDEKLNTSKEHVQKSANSIHVATPASASADWDRIRNTILQAKEDEDCRLEDACSTDNRKAIEEEKARSASSFDNTVEKLDALRLSDLAKDEAIGGMAVAIKNQYATIAEQDKAIERLESALAQAGAWFGQYGINHRAKNPPDVEKAKTNEERAQFCLDAVNGTAHGGRG